ncbi:MAG: DUF418 domain-containing protein [Candidatus Methylumidiphilus sp.]
MSKNTNRITVIDAVRGLAMLGIMMVNFPSINTTAGDESTRYGGISSQADELANTLSIAFMNGKFYPIFAFLFGLGMFIFMDNAQKKGFSARMLMTRRLAFLALFGCLHISLVWWGDILLCYALLGFVLMLCFNFSIRTLLYLAAANGLGILILQGIIELGESLHWWNSQLPVHLGLVNIQVDHSAAAAIYASGGFFEISGLRIKDYLYDFYKPLLLGATTFADVVAYLVYYARIFGLFSLGMACGRSGLHRNIFAKIGLVRRIWTVSASISLPLLAVMFFVHVSSEFVHGLSCIFLAFFYMTSMVLLANNKRTVKFLYFFVPVGRMSLTAYLAHTTVFSFFLYGYGLGFYGKIGPAFLILMALVFYAMVFVFCHYWQRCFGMGPFEKVWRKLTYGNLESTLNKA